MRHIRHLPRLCCLLLVATAATAVEPALSPDLERVRAHAEALLAIPDRSMGSPGADAAADLIRERLDALGLEADRIREARTTVTVPVDHGSSLRVAAEGGETIIQLAPHVPNGAALNTTGGEPITGPLVILGRGDAAALRAHGKDLPGSIVVLDGDSGDAWLDCAEMGALAVIFRKSERIDHHQLTQQFVTASLSFPRFVGEIDDALQGAEATLTSTVTMERRNVRTLCALIEGEIGQHTAVLASGYEAAGLIPGHDPAATRAWNAALLLELGRQFAEHPPRNNILLVFHGGRAEHFRGLRMLLASLNDPALSQNENTTAIEAKRLALDIWRTEQVRRAFTAFLDQTDEASPETITIAKLEELLRAINEDTLEPFLEEDEPQATTATIPEADAKQVRRGVVNRILAVFFTAGLMLVFFIRWRTGRPGWFLLTAIAIGGGLVIYQLVAPVEPETIVTEVAEERKQVEDLGLAFLSEEAGRRADQEQPVVERLRLYTKLTEKQKVSAENRLQRLLLQEELEALRGEALPSDRERLVKLTADLGDHIQLMRDVQQKLGKMELNDREAAVVRPMILDLLGDSDEADTIIGSHLRTLRLRHRDLQDALAIQEMVGPGRTALLIGFDLTDGNCAFSAAVLGSIAAAAKKLTWIGNECQRVAHDLDTDHLDGALAFDPSPYGQHHGSPTAWWPQFYAHEAGVANLYLNALTLSTVNDKRAKIGTPQDTAAAFDTGTGEGPGYFARQTRGLTALVRDLVENTNYTSKRLDLVKKGLAWKTVEMQTESRGSATGLKGFPFGELHVQEGPALGYFPDVRPVQIFWTDAFGKVTVPWLPNQLNEPNPGTWALLPFAHDSVGRLTHVLTVGKQKTAGLNAQGFDVKGSLRDMLTQVFACQTSQLYNLTNPRSMMPLNEVRVLSSSRDAPPDASYFESDGQVAAVFATKGTRLRIIARQGSVGREYLLLGDHEQGDEFLGLRPGGPLNSVLARTLRPSVDPTAAAGQTAQPDPAPEADSDEEQPEASDGPAVADLPATADKDAIPLVLAERAAAPAALAVAQDFFQICRARLERLQRFGINPESLWALHAKAQSELDEAKRLLKAGDVQGAEGAAEAAWSLENRVYPALLATANDVVYGLVVMLILAIPFSMICERLFVSGNTIFTKVAGFGAFFVATFLFFFFFHPAFSLAVTPIIIFLAFVIIVMSVLVIGIIYRQFEASMTQMRMQGLGMHRADVNRLGTLLATGQLGISNMRRRPLRTFLTATTVVLMTFILLTFAGFGSKAGIRQQDLEVAPAYNGIFLSQPGWLPFAENSVDRTVNTWDRDLHVFPRRWLMAGVDVPRFDINHPEGDEPTSLMGVVGVDPGDPSGAERSALRVWFEDGERHTATGFASDEDWIFLPQRLIDNSGYREGDSIPFQGQRLRLGVLQQTGDDAFTKVTHLDGSPFTPLAPEAMDEEQRKHFQEMKKQAAEGGEVVVESTSLTHLDADQVALTSNAVLARLGAEIRSIAMVPWTDAARQQQRDPERHLPAELADLDELGAEVTNQLALSVLLGNKGKTHRMTAVGQLAIGGLADVLIPLILGGMIIYSTMLGSVAERGKEIFIYSSLGLAPIHIAALFLVEATIYAVIGGMGGYIVAQMLIALLGFLADVGLLATQPDINYSSFTAVITILLVMATVLLSALYPAFVASRAANPGTERRFRVPQPDGDDLDIEFPFTVAARDIRGLLAYLKTFMDANTEASTGCFTAADAEMVADGDIFAVLARTWLAPFDLGISQTFRMTAKPTDMKAIYSIHISLHLLSGQRSAWRRVTIPFIQELRQQFLVWRTLDEQTTDRYRAAGGDPDAAQRVAEHEREAAVQRVQAEKDMKHHHRRGGPETKPAADDAEQPEDKPAAHKVEGVADTDDAAPPQAAPPPEEVEGDEQRKGGRS